MIEPQLKQLSVAQDRIDPLNVFATGALGMEKDLGAGANHGERPTYFVHDTGQEPADLDKLLIEHRHARHLAKLNQPSHPAEHDGAGDRKSVV